MSKTITNEQLLTAVQDLSKNMDKGFEQVDRRFEQVDKRFDQVDKKFDQVDKRFDLQDKTFNSKIDKLAQMTVEGFEELETKLEGKIEQSKFEIRKEIKQSFRYLADEMNSHDSQIKTHDKRIKKIEHAVL